MNNKRHSASAHTLEKLRQKARNQTFGVLIQYRSFGYFWCDIYHFGAGIQYNKNRTQLPKCHSSAQRQHDIQNDMNTLSIDTISNLRISNKIINGK